jgi:hypothetical protein
MQIDQDRLDSNREMNYQWVQTERIQLANQPKPYTIDEEVEANIVLRVPCEERSTQTAIKQYIDSTMTTEMIISINREIQFPEETSRAMNIDEIVDPNYQHLYEKRRNIIDNEEYYSVDRFEEKTSKYKWIGRAKLSDSPEEIKRKMFLECLVFSVYNYYGIKTPEKRLTFQMCSNVSGEKAKDGLLHVLTFDNPELQYLNNFEDFNYAQRKFPLSEVITFKSSHQPIKFNNYGGLLALAYFLNDYEVYSQQNNQLGFVIVN